MKTSDIKAYDALALATHILETAWTERNRRGYHDNGIMERALILALEALSDYEPISRASCEAIETSKDAKGI